jgi:hypothetical protein
VLLLAINGWSFILIRAIMNARISTILAVFVGFLAYTPLSQAAESPLAHYAGNWSGSGKIVVSNGASERIRCRGTYRQTEGGGLSLTLRCASDSYKFELSSDIKYDGGSISGSWNETSRGVAGSLSGKATSTHIEASAQTVGFTASLSIALRGNSQSVSIRSPGSEISEVSVSLARGR